MPVTVTVWARAGAAEASVSSETAASVLARRPERMMMDSLVYGSTSRLCPAAPPTPWRPGQSDDWSLRQKRGRRHGSGQIAAAAVTGDERNWTDQPSPCPCFHSDRVDTGF